MTPLDDRRISVQYLEMRLRFIAPKPQGKLFLANRKVAQHQVVQPWGEIGIDVELSRGRVRFQPE